MWCSKSVSWHSKKITVDTFTRWEHGYCCYWNQFPILPHWQPEFFEARECANTSRLGWSLWTTWWQGTACAGFKMIQVDFPTLQECNKMTQLYIYTTHKVSIDNALATLYFDNRTRAGLCQTWAHIQSITQHSWTRQQHLSLHGTLAASTSSAHSPESTIHTWMTLKHLPAGLLVGFKRGSASRAPSLRGVVIRLPTESSASIAYCAFFAHVSLLMTLKNVREHGARRPAHIKHFARSLAC